MNGTPNQFNRWWNQRQIKLLESAYQSAEEIKALEDKYFQGNPINYCPESQKTVVDFVKSLRDRYLFKLRFNLAQFKINSFLLPQTLGDKETVNFPKISESEIIEKLNFIDSVVKRYRDNPEEILIESLANPPNINSSTLMGLTSEEVKQEQNESASTLTLDPAVIAAQSNLSRQSQAKSWFNWGFFKGQTFTPNYEQQVVKELRIRRIQDQIAIRWLGILFLIPL